MLSLRIFQLDWSSGSVTSESSSSARHSEYSRGIYGDTSN